MHTYVSFFLIVLEGLDCCEQLASTLALTLAVTAAAHPLQLTGTFTVCVLFSMSVVGYYCLAFSLVGSISRETKFFSGFSFVYISHFSLLLSADANMVDVMQFLKLLDPLLVLVTQTTPVIDGAAKGTFY